jgi:hypothetical protein
MGLGHTLMVQRLSQRLFIHVTWVIPLLAQNIGHVWPMVLGAGQIRPVALSVRFIPEINKC